MEKRLIVAIALSVLVVVLFQSLLKPPAPPQAAPITAEAQRPDILPMSQAQQKVPALFIPEKKPSREIETVYETDRFELTFTNIGGALKGFKLKEYKTELVKDLESPIATFALYSDAIDPDLAAAEYELSKESGKIAYTYKTARNINITKEFIIHNNCDFIELQLKFENIASAPISIVYSINGPSGIGAGLSMKDRNFIEMDAMVDGRIVKKSRIKGGQEAITGIISWVAIKDRYFAVALKPNDAAESVFARQIKGNLLCGLNMKTQTIHANSCVRNSYFLYMGPLLKERVAAIDPYLGGLVDFGFFGAISMFLLAVLGAINTVVRNWGVSIIAVTCLINLILYPLTKKSFHSMQKMQEIQPHMEKLRKLHKDNPQKLNKELAELYKEYNVNPFGGCLPMLLQLPIFIGFYQALMRSIQLKGAHFLWIKDLSMPDALFTFKDALPLVGNHFNLLPIITIIVMFIQQKQSTARPKTGEEESELAKQQKLMALFFPAFFGFILYNFPSGLVLYWMTNSVLMIIEQGRMRRKPA